MQHFFSFIFFLNVICILKFFFFFFMELYYALFFPRCASLNVCVINNYY